MGQSEKCNLSDTKMDKISIILLLTIGLFAVVQSKATICGHGIRCVKCTNLFGCYTCCDNNRCIACDSSSGLCTYECCEGYGWCH